MWAPSPLLLRSFKILIHGHINDGSTRRLMHPLRMSATLTKWRYGSALKDSIEHKNLFFDSMSSLKWLQLTLVTKSFAIYIISTFMLVDSSEKELITLRPLKRGKRRGSIYFSSSKVLRRSRMRRGGRSALKTSEPSQPDIQRVLRFKLPDSAREEDASHDDVQGNEDAWTEDVTCGHGAGTLDVLQVRNYSILFHLKGLHRRRTHQGCQD